MIIRNKHISLTKYSNFWILILSAIIISSLINAKFLTYLVVILQDQSFSEISIGIRNTLNIGVKDFILQIVLFLTLAFYNFSWKNYLLPKQVKNGYKVFLNVLYNIVLILVLFLIDTFFERHLNVDSQTALSIVLVFLFKNIWSIVLAILISHFITYRIKSKKIKENLAKLKEEKVKAEIAILQEQLSPHFFFNTLSTLSAVIKNEEREKGLEFVQNMSNVYRYTLELKKEHMVPVREELEFVKAYTYLLQSRFGNKLQILIDLDDNVLTNKVLPMSLQLLIENAIQHNVITKNKPLQIIIKTENDFICVENNIQKRKAVDSFGIGLNNINNRYKLLMNKEIEIISSKEMFKVKLPLL